MTLLNDSGARPPCLHNLLKHRNETDTEEYTIVCPLLHIQTYAQDPC